MDKGWTRRKERKRRKERGRVGREKNEQGEYPMRAKNEFERFR